MSPRRRVSVARKARFPLVFDLEEGLRIVNAVDPVEDDVVEAIGAAGDLIESPEGLGRPPWRQNYHERAAGDGSPDLLLSRRPIESVSKVTVDGVEIPPSSIIVREGGLERTDGLPWPSGSVVRADYTAGWVWGGMLTDWKSTTLYAVGDLVIAGDLVAECATRGFSGEESPVWPAIAGEAVEDGTASWTLHAVHRPPSSAVACGRALVRLIYDGLFEREPGLAELRDGGSSMRYTIHHSAINNRVRSVLRGLR